MDKVIERASEVFETRVLSPIQITRQIEHRRRSFFICKDF